MLATPKIQSRENRRSQQDQQTSEPTLGQDERTRRHDTNTNSANQKLEAYTLLTQEELSQFQDIALREYRVQLTDAQAYEQATALLMLFETLLTNTEKNTCHIAKE